MTLTHFAARGKSPRPAPGAPARGDSDLCPVCNGVRHAYRDSLGEELVCPACARATAADRPRQPPPGCSHCGGRSFIPTEAGDLLACPECDPGSAFAPAGDPVTAARTRVFNAPASLDPADPAAVLAWMDRRDGSGAARQAVRVLVSVLRLAAGLAEQFDEDFDNGSRLPPHWPEDTARKVRGAGMACVMFCESVPTNFTIEEVDGDDLPTSGAWLRALAAESDRADEMYTERFAAADRASEAYLEAADQPAAEGGAP